MTPDPPASTGDYRHMPSQLVLCSWGAGRGVNLNPKPLVYAKQVLYKLRYIPNNVALEVLQFSEQEYGLGSHCLSL